MALATQSHVGAISEDVAKLRDSFGTGRTRSLDWRRRQLERLVAMLSEREADFVEALQLDLGKPKFEGWATDLALVHAEADYARKHLDAWTKPERVWTPLNQHPAKARVHREPLGVVLIIGPWNYPIQLVLSPLVGAIAAGNCAVLKPSEVAPHASQVLARLVPEYLDADCIAVVEGGVPQAHALLAERFDHIFYTGNGAVGRIVMEAAAKHLTPVTLELGGKSPVIVDRHAKLDVAARRITWGKFLNAGQTCVAPDYVLVDRELEEPLVEGIRNAIREFYGDDPKQSPDYGRIVNDRHFARLTPMLDDGVIAIGGDADAAQRYLAPTVLQEVPLDGKAMADEIFGPILPILPVPDVDAAIDFVNERDKPLALYVFSEQESVRNRVVEVTSSGGMCVNGVVMQVGLPTMPFGGVGPSGMGAYHGKASFETFSHRKSVLTKSTRLDPSIAYAPYTRAKERIIRRFL